MLNVNQIFMIHYKPLKRRRDFILQHVNYDMQWIESEPNQHYWTTDKQSWNKKCPTEAFRQLNQAEISLVHKHIEVYKEIVQNQYSVSLVLEDDVLLHWDFAGQFNYCLENTPTDWDFIFIGSGCNLHIPPERILPGKIAYKKNHPASKCTDSYCITLEAAKKILSTIIPFTLPIDFELNYQMALHNMNVYWWEPPLVRQGSQVGLYKSEIQ